MINEKRETVLLKGFFPAGQEAVNESEIKGIVEQQLEECLQTPWSPGDSAEAVLTCRQR